MTSDDVPAFGDLIRHARHAAGLTHEELAERSGLSVRGISDLERGVVRAPRRDTLELLADALELSADERRRWEELRRKRAPRRGAPRSRRPARASPAGNLPAPLTSLIGREREVREVAARLETAEGRLVTVTGPGGVGKTRLAIEVGQRLRDMVPGGVWFVDLAPTGSPDLVVPMIATTLGISATGSQSAHDALVEALQTSVRLLVLDNFEHLVDAAPDVARLLASCPLLKVLVTSRAALRVQGEQEYPLAPLPLPAPSAEASAAMLAENAAVRLFTLRAQAARPAFETSEATIQVVAEICRRLDGLPLALELAAARVRLLPPQAMLERMERRLPLLIGGARDLPARQRTLRSTIQWSYDLLTPEEQRLLRTLAVFRGGWTLEAAQAITDPSLDVLAGMQALVEHSLIQVSDQAAGRYRYTMLETLREFGLEELGACDELDRAHRRHTAYYLELAERVKSVLSPGGGQREWWRQIRDEMDNIRAVLERAISAGDGLTAQRLTGAIGRFWSTGGHTLEARHWLASALALDGEVPASVRARACVAFGHVLRSVGEMTQADRYARQALALFEEAGDLVGCAEALVLASWVDIYRGDFEGAKAAAERAREIARAAGEKHVAAAVADTLCVVALGDRDYERSEALCSESLVLYRDAGDLRNVGRLLGFLGYIALWQGDTERAARFAAECLEQTMSVSDVEFSGFALELMAYVDLERADHRQAYARFARSLSIDHETGSMMSFAENLEGMAAAAAGLGDHLHGARLLGAAAAVRERIGSLVPPPRQERYDRTLAAVRDGLDDATFARAEAEGRCWTVDEAFDRALTFGEGLVELSATAGRSPLSPRETDVLHLLIEGRSNQEIAEALFISPHTVANHVASIMNKLGVDSRTAAAAWAVKQGIA